MILARVVLGLSTRKNAETLLALLGRPISASTVSTDQRQRGERGRQNAIPRWPVPSAAAEEPLKVGDVLTATTSCQNSRCEIHRRA